MIIKTFKLRLAIYCFSATLLIFLLLLGIILIQYKEGTISEVDNKLIEEVKKNLLPDFEKNRTVKNAEVIRKRADEYYQIINIGNSFIIVDLNEKGHGLPFNKALLLNSFGGSIEFETIKHNNENFRVLYFPADRENIIRISYPLSSKDEDYQRLQRLFIFSLPFLFFISAGLGWLIAGMAVSPINKMKSAAEKIINEGSEDRINIKLKGEEFRGLIKIFNEIFDRNERLINTQRHFASDLSHEIRSPLTSLRGNIEVALRKKRHVEEYEEILRNSLFDIIRLSKITDNLLFLAKADNNILQLRRQRIDVNDLLKAVVEHFADRIINAELNLVEEYQEALVLNCDRDMLEQAFANLIENAIKYTPSGGTIKIKTWGEKDYIKISINDNGVGIPQEDIPHIFERFYRSKREDSIKRKGSGLGLALTKWIIDSHEGNISVKSVVGVGSEFLIVFPK